MSKNFRLVHQIPAVYELPPWFGAAWEVWAAIWWEHCD